MSKVLRLFPTPHQILTLKGLYLKENLHKNFSGEEPFIYANFVTSLDGRIALIDPHRNASFMPQGLSNANDFRLLLELQAQADCIVIHSGYLRALEQGRLDNIIQVGAQACGSDLPAWREQQGLDHQPHVIVASASLDFPLPESLRAQRQAVFIATSQRANPERIHFWESRGYKILFAGNERLVEGAALTRELALLGYRTVYLMAGPLMLDSMLRQGMLARLYLTLRHQLLGGEAFHSMIPGAELGQAGMMTLRSLYYDASNEGGCGQIFASYET